MLGQALELALSQAFEYARKRGHEFLTLEHLLLALLDNAHVKAVLSACDADIPVLQQNLTDYIADTMPSLPEDSDRETQPSIAFQRVLQRAVMHVQSSGGDEVNGANVLVAMFSEQQSQSIYLLAQLDISRLDVVNAISHGVDDDVAEISLDENEVELTEETEEKSDPLDKPLDSLDDFDVESVEIPMDDDLLEDVKSEEAVVEPEVVHDDFEDIDIDLGEDVAEITPIEDVEIETEDEIKDEMDPLKKPLDDLQDDELDILDVEENILATETLDEIDPLDAPLPDLGEDFADEAIDISSLDMEEVTAPKDTKVSSDSADSEKTDEVVNEDSYWQLSLLLILFVSIIFVSIKAVVHRHESRTLFMELQVLEKDRDKLAAQWSRLKLEQGTLLNQVSVERQARWDLGMEIPKTTDIKIVREKIKKEEKPVSNGPIDSKVVLGD